MFSYGDTGDRVIVGDWDGDGADTVGIYRPSNGRLYLNFENESASPDWTGFAGYPKYLLTAGHDAL